MKSDPKVFIPIFLISPIPFVTFTPPISPLYFIIFTLINMYIIAKIYKLIRQNMEIKKEHLCESALFIFILRLISAFRQRGVLRSSGSGLHPEAIHDIILFIAIPENNAKNSALQNVNYCVTDFRRTPVRLQIRSL